ncbi:hypothetical protein [Haloferula sp. BvORR071]|uniref:hypothetical protein n=1 Tax=Haloferula sp. BvORR071 TaxID=1396141 RepID=UPI00055514BE|nr:hypothetical protein [Haloferula sp. BvORR071]
MGWNTSIACGGPWNPDLLDSLAPGYEKQAKTTDFGTATSSDSTGRIAIGILPNGVVVAATRTEYDALTDLSLMLSANGRSGVFHLGSTACYYEYQLHAFGETLERRSTGGDDDNGFDDDSLDPDDTLSLLDEEDGIGNVELDEDGLLALFLRTIGQPDWRWQDDLRLHYYSPLEV